MKQVGKWWLPEEETHLTDYVMREGEYQQKQRSWALRGLEPGGLAIDVGAHVGLWLRDLCDHFTHVWAIEPRDLHRQCLTKNLAARTNYTLIAALAGAQQSQAGIREYPGNTGHTHWQPEGSIPVITIDSLELNEVRFIKIDVEGFEREVIRGAEQTIKQQRPRICLEQKAHPLADEFGGRYAARDLLRSWGYQPLKHHGDDHVLEWRG